MVEQFFFLFLLYPGKMDRRMVGLQFLYGWFKIVNAGWINEWNMSHSKNDNFAGMLKVFQDFLLFPGSSKEERPFDSKYDSGCVLNSIENLSPVLEIVLIGNNKKEYHAP